MSSNRAKYSDVATAAATKTDNLESDDVIITAFEVEEEEEEEESSASSPLIPRGQVQPPQYRDKWFGILFLLQLGAMLSVAALFASGSIAVTAFVQEEDDQQEEEETNDSLWNTTGQEVSFVSTLVVSMILSIVLAVVALSLMFRHGQRLIEVSLKFGIVWNGAMALLSLLTGNVGGAILFGILTAILVCYVKAVWHRIPFAAANLKAAVTCVQSNWGMAALSIASVPLTALWGCLWFYVTMNTMQSDFMKQQITSTDASYQGGGTSTNEETLSPLGTAVWAALLLSLYWTLQVMGNTIHTTIAGTVGTWWFLPQEANSCCSSGLTDSMGRTMTYSFGSVCLGSLIVALIQVLRSLLNSAANNRNNRGGMVSCIARCLLLYVERIAEYFNKWAFIYVGLYGYGYVEAGKNVIHLFQQRGWTTIISDSLVHRMLGMMCLGIGIINALVGALLALVETRDGFVVGMSAFCAFCLGILLSSLVFQVLSSSVDTIIVLYAEAPNECHQNHPQLAREMHDTWSQAWPDVFSGFPQAQVLQVAE